MVSCNSGQRSFRFAPILFEAREFLLRNTVFFLSALIGTIKAYLFHLGTLNYLLNSSQNHKNFRIQLSTLNVRFISSEFLLIDLVALIGRDFPCRLYESVNSDLHIMFLDPMDTTSFCSIFCLIKVLYHPATNLY